jgi:hypothetical protein
MRCVVRRIDCEGDFICNRSVNGYYSDMANRKRTDLSSLLERLIDAVSREIAARAGGGVRGGRRGGRGGPGRKLDMRCRVEGCKNMSRGPRFGFICDEHQKSLSKKAQQAARDAYKAKQKG